MIQFINSDVFFGLNRPFNQPNIAQINPPPYNPPPYNAWVEMGYQAMEFPIFDVIFGPFDSH